MGLESLRKTHTITEFTDAVNNNNTDGILASTGFRHITLTI